MRISSQMKLFFPVASLVLALDVGIKQLMLSWLFFPPQQIIVTPFFSLTPVWNSGISFGLFSDNPYIGLFSGLSGSLTTLLFCKRLAHPLSLVVHLVM